MMVMRSLSLTMATVAGLMGFGGTSGGSTTAAQVVFRVAAFSPALTLVVSLLRT